MVYFIHDAAARAIKIGCIRQDFENPDWQSALATRLQDLQIGNPNLLHVIGFQSGMYGEEHKLHKDFSRNHLRGEWFQESARLLWFAIERGGKAPPYSSVELCRLRAVIEDGGYKVPSLLRSWIGSALRHEQNVSYVGAA